MNRAARSPASSFLSKWAFFVQALEQFFGNDNLFLDNAAADRPPNLLQLFFDLFIGKYTPLRLNYL